MSTNAPFDVFDCALDGTQLIEASAGTGKTWNICGLYLRLLIERDLPVASILVVTFTNAATAELRERIRSRIVLCLDHLHGRAHDAAFAKPLLDRAERAGVAAHDIERRLVHALATFDEASIFTIHGFCQRALADAPFTAGVPFALDVLQDDRELQLEVVQDFWRQNIAGSDCNRALASWMVDHRDSPESWAKALGRRIAKPLAQLRWPDDIEVEPVLDPTDVERTFAALEATWTAARDRIVQLLQGASETALRQKTHGPKPIAEALREWDVLIARGNPFARFARDTKLPICGAASLAEGTKVRCATPVHAFCEQADEWLAAREALDAQLTLARLRLVKRLMEGGPKRLRQRKRDKRVLAYDDILFNLHHALHGERGPALVPALRDRFPAALIDEFQDTDPVQFAIFRAIYSGTAAPVFFVGDPKQAIYSFRNADLHTYMRAARLASRRETLDSNQRSTPDLIAAVNALFGANDGVFMLPDLRYHPVQPGQKKLRKLTDLSTPARSDFCVWLLPTNDQGAPLERKEALQFSARAIAGEISRLLREARAGRVRLDADALEPRHIAVLVRSHREGAIVRQALRTLGIGSVELAQDSVFATPDAEEVERVLAAVLDPAHTGYLKSALATELLGCDADAIAAIADDERELTSRMERFARYRDAWLQQGVGVAYRRLLSEEGVSARMLKRTDGERRLTNLLHIGERLHEASVLHQAPDALLRWLHAQRTERRSEEAMQLRLESDRDLVHIVTVHKSKGLEYPIVFCPFLWDNQRPPRDSGLGACTYHDANGDTVIDYREAEQQGDDVRWKIKLEGLAESVRLMYVALTRASHRCHLVAGCYGTWSWGKLTTTSSTRSLLNWLVAGHGTTPEDWVEHKLDAETIIARWQALARDNAKHMSLALLPVDDAPPLGEAALDPANLSVPAPPNVPPAWRIASYSGLLLDVASEAAADHDLRVASPVARVLAPADVAPDDILAFPRGPIAGECLHAVFEHADFAEPATWPKAIDRALAAFPFGGGAGGHARRKAMIAAMLHDVLATQLTDGIRLDGVSKTARLTELGFHLPSPRLHARALNEFLRRDGYTVPQLAFRDMSGYLSGFIDLVLEHAGRYYIVDWKSNHLGYACANYDASMVAAAMIEHAYHLQHVLYALALHRYLSRRLAGYDFEHHFGGVLYLFVRGVRPQWKNADGSAAGVYFHRLRADTLAALVELFPQHAAAATP